MDETSILTVLGSVVGALTTTKAWEYYARKLQDKKDEEKADKEDKNLYRDDLRKEVQQLREKLEKNAAERHTETQDFLKRINDLSQELAAMKVRVEFLEKENANLRNPTPPSPIIPAPL